MMSKVFILILFLLNQLVNIQAQENDSTKLNALEEVTISAYRTNSELSKIPHQLKVIQIKEISSLSVNSLDDLLKKNTNIDVVQYPGFNSTISMRGFAPASQGNTLILFNGIPVGTENISTLNLENIAQVEVLKGPFSSFFGSNAMSGVINLAPKVSRGKTSGGASFTYGSFDIYKINANIGGKISKLLNFDFYTAANAQRKNYKTGNGNLLKLTDLEKLVMEEKSYGSEFKNTKYWQYSIGGRIGLQLNKKWTIDLNQDYWFAKDIQTNGTFWGVYGPAGKDINRWSQSLCIEGKAGNHKLRLSPFYSNENTIFYNDVTANNYKISNANFKTYGVIINDALQIGKHQLIFGSDNLTKKYISKRWEDTENQSSPYQPDYLNMATGLYLQANLNFLDDKLNASFGGRFDNIVFKLFETELIESVDATEKYNVFNPNFGIQLKVLNGFKIHVAAGTAFLAPDAFKVAGNYSTSGMYGVNYRGNPDLKPEKSVTYDFGLAYNNRKTGVNTDFTYFRTSYEDMVVYDYSNIDYISFNNANKANMDGVEIMFDFDLGALNNYKYSLKFYADYTHLFNANVKKEDSEEQMKYVRIDKASFGVNFDNNKGFCTRINARYVGSRNEDNWAYTYDIITYERIPYQTVDGQDIRPELINEEVLKHPDFLLFDFSASYTFKEKYCLGLKVDNLFNDNYTEKDTYYMPGRTILGSISFKF